MWGPGHQACLAPGNEAQPAKERPQHEPVDRGWGGAHSQEAHVEAHGSQGWVLWDQGQENDPPGRQREVPGGVKSTTSPISFHFKKSSHKWIYRHHSHATNIMRTVKTERDAREDAWGPLGVSGQHLRHGSHKVFMLKTREKKCLPLPGTPEE